MLIPAHHHSVTTLDSWWLVRRDIALSCSFHRLQQHAWKQCNIKVFRKAAWNQALVSIFTSLMETWKTNLMLHCTDNLSCVLLWRNVKYNKMLSATLNNKSTGSLLEKLWAIYQRVKFRGAVVFEHWSKDNLWPILAGTMFDLWALQSACHWASYFLNGKYNIFIITFILR